MANLGQRFCLETLITKLFATKIFKLCKYHARLTLQHYRHWMKNSVLRSIAFSSTRYWGSSQQELCEVPSSMRSAKFSTWGRKLGCIATDWEPTSWKTTPLKSFWGHRGGSQVAYKPIKCSHIKQIHTLGGLQPANCRKWLHLFLLGIGEAHVE